MKIEEAFARYLGQEVLVYTVSQEALFHQL